MVGTLFPVNGEIYINGKIPKKRQPSFLKTIYYIPEDVFVPPLTIKQYENLFAPFYPEFKKADFYHYLDVLEVSVDGKLNKLSFGQQKKFVIAFALACNTKVLLMDEPTNGLDIPSKSTVQKIDSLGNVRRQDHIYLHPPGSRPGEYDR